MKGKQVTELDALPSFTDNSLLPVHNGTGLKKGLLSQLANYLGKKFSNPNLLINPDFKINQRGSANYTSNGYTVDRWKVNNGTVKPQSNGVSVTLNNKGQFIQLFENTLSGTYTATIKVTSITGDCVLFIGSHSLQLNKAGTFTITENGSITGISLYKSTAGTCTINVEYIKLEQGSVSTPFIVPDYTTELTKCERYYLLLPKSLVGYRFSGVIYIPVTNLNKMKAQSTLKVIGVNNDTNVVTLNEIKQNCQINTSSNVQYKNGHIQLALVSNSPTMVNCVIGVDFNNTALAIDAEIY